MWRSEALVFRYDPERNFGGRRVVLTAEDVHRAGGGGFGMRLTNRAAERFQRALEGERVTDAELEGLLQTSRALSSVPLAGAAPREGFVLALRERLMAEAEQMPSPSPSRSQGCRGAQGCGPQRAGGRCRGPRLPAGARRRRRLRRRCRRHRRRRVAQRHPGLRAVPGQGLARLRGRADGRVRLRPRPDPPLAGAGAHLRRPCACRAVERGPAGVRRRAAVRGVLGALRPARPQHVVRRHGEPARPSWRSATSRPGPCRRSRPCSRRSRRRRCRCWASCRRCSRTPRVPHCADWPPARRPAPAPPGHR